MSALLLAAHGMLAAVLFLGVVSVTALLGRRLHQDDFSWKSYVVFAVIALALASGLVFTSGSGVGAAAFYGLFALLVVTVMVRAASDAQSKSLAEKVGFLQLYVGLFFAQVMLLKRAAALDGVSAPPWLSFEIHDRVAHLLLPLPSLVLGSAAVPSWADPSRIAFAAASTISGNLLLIVALTTFALSGLAYAYFAEQTTPNVGLSLLPAPTVATVVFLAAWAVESLLGGTPRVAAFFVRIVLAPYFVAEGLWVFHRMARRLRTRGAWTAILGGAALVMPGLVAVLAWIGIAFHVVQLRAFQPVLGDLERSASRPRIGAAFGASMAAALVFVALALVDRAAVARLSPALESAPAVCGQTTLTPSAGGVTVKRGDAVFTIDRDETALPVNAVNADYAAAMCSARGARLCTSDEWTLACLCTYANESDSGPKVTTNERLAYRVESDLASAERPDAAHRDVDRLLTGASEIVAPLHTNGGVLVAGSTDAVNDPWTADCRHRSLVTARGLSDNAWPFVGVRCCR